MKEFLQRAAAFIMLAVYSLSVAPAREMAFAYHSAQQNFQAYLERAEVQSDKEKFQKIAEQGIGAAIAEWEQESLELKFSDYDEWLLQRESLENSLNAYKDFSFAQWLLKKQEQEKEQLESSALYQELHQAALEFAYKKADGTTTRIVPKEFIDEAKEQWAEIAQGIVQSHTRQTSVSFLHEQALSLEAAVTNSLMNMLLYDQDSLKKMSDERAASAIVKQLADDIESQTAQSMAQLFDSMQTQLDSPDAASVNGTTETEWLSKFERELQAGLSKWDEAERSFLAARVEWEREAENIFINDNQKWLEAYNELESRKNKWAQEINEQIEEGKKKWQAKLDELENEASAYLSQLQEKLSAEVQQKRDIVDAGIETYNQCREILAMAQNGISNWYARWTEKYDGTYSYWKTEDIPDDAQAELQEWLDLYDQYSAEAQNAFLQIYSLTGGGIESTEYDEIANERAKLFALESYYQSRAEICQAVYDYSQNSYSSAEAAAETLDRLQRAKEKYDAQKSDYQKKLEALDEIKKEVKQAESDYAKKQEETAAALQAIDQERIAYDTLCDRLNVLREESAFSEIVSLNEKLQKIELSDEDFYDLLLQYYFANLDAEYFITVENARQIKESFETGVAEIDTQELLKDFDQETLERLKETEGFDYTGLSVRVFSNSEQHALQKNLQEILSAEELDLPAISEILVDLMEFDKEGGKALSTDLQEEELDTEKIKADLENILQFCEDEIRKRQAILMLLEETGIEKIEEFFNENPDLQYLESEYEDFSVALLTKKQNLARKAISSMKDPQQIVRGGLNESGFLVLQLYTGALQSQSNAQSAAGLNEALKEVFGEKEIFVQEETNWHIAAFEKFFSEENLTRPSGTSDDFSLLGAAAQHSELLQKIKTICFDSKDKEQSIKTLEEQLKTQAEKIAAAQELYDQKAFELRGNNEESALKKYNAACQKYNAALQKAHAFYESMQAAQQEYRIAEEVYFYAQNEYLHGNTENDTAAELESLKQKLSGVKTALQVLDEIENQKESAAFDSVTEFNEYKESARQYYTTRVLSYEYNREIDAQEQRLAQAQQEESIAISRLVGEAQEVPSIANDFVYAEKTKNGEYIFSLVMPQDMKNIDESARQKSDAVLAEYYATQAMSDALKFITGFENKKYTIEDVALALLYLKLQGTDEQKEKWILDGENPYNDQNYKMDNIPEKMHSVELWDDYHDGRIQAIRNAYSKVIQNNGKQDLIDYILFSQSNINPALDLATRQYDTISVRGMDNVCDGIDHQVNVLTISAVAQLALVSAFSVIACIPLFGAWAIVPLAAATAVYISLIGAADKLNDVKNDVIKIQDGYSQIIQARQTQQQEYIEQYRKAAAKRQAEEERLNVLLYGRHEASDKKITWKEFKQSLDEFLATNSSVQYSYFENMHSANTKDLHALFNEVAKGKCSTASQAISLMAKALATEYSQCAAALDAFQNEQIDAKNSASNEFYSLIENDSGTSDEYKARLSTAAQNAWGNTSFDSKAYKLELAEFYSKEILSSLPAHFGAPRENCEYCQANYPCECNATEDYFEDIFSILKELYDSALLEESAAKMQTKQIYLETLKFDLQEQSDEWLRKIQSAAQIGIDEWQKADEKLNAAYNAWQKQWLMEYQETNDEWDSNYEEFLADKQEWINNSYLNAGDVQIKNYAATSRIKRATQMSGSISEYVSSLYDHERFTALAALTQKISSFEEDNSYKLGLLAYDNMDSSILFAQSELYSKQQKIENDMKAAAAKYQSQNIKAQAEESVKNYFAMIDEKNKSMEDWEIDLVKKSGYSVDSEIHRDAIVDSTAFKTIREKQTVHRYEFFTANAPNVSFSKQEYSGTNEYRLMKETQELQQKIQAWYEEIFGSQDTNQSPGKLQEHIGRSSTLVELPDLEKTLQENLEDAGSGQLGLIMADFQWNALKNSQGYAELAKPIYEQKIFDKDCWFQLPTIRDIFGIICEIIGNVVGPWAKYIDDTIFGILDVSMGYKTIAEVATDALKQGLISAVSYGVSAAGSAVFSQIGSAIGKGAQILQAVQNASVNLATNVAAGYINAFDFVRGTMDWEQANSVWTSAGTWTSMAGTMVGGMIGELNNVDSYGNRLNKNVFVTNIENMNNTIGSLSGAALNYMFTGDFSVNIASVKGVNLFEIGVKNGKFQAGIGQGGVDLSYNAIKTFVQGAKDAAAISELKKGSLEDKIVKLNAANLLGYSGTQSNIELARRLFDAEQEFAFMELSGEKELSTMQGAKIILDSSLLSRDKDSQAAVASLLAYQNAFVSDTSLDLSKIDFSKLKKHDGTAYTKEEIEAAKKKIGSDNTLSAMLDSAAAFAVAHDILGSDYDSVTNMENLSTIAEAYKAGGAAGVFAVYAQISAMQKKSEEKTEEKKAVGDKGSGVGETAAAEKISAETESQGMKLSFENVMRLNWYQNENINENILLGFSMTKEEYNNLAKQNAAERYANERLSEIEISEDSVKLTKEILIAYALKDEKLLVEYGYKEQNDETTIATYGCTLSTVAYIAYSITGKVISLKEANEILKENDLFCSTIDKNGIEEKNLIGVGKGYADAVNALAGGNYLKMDGNQNTVSEYSANKIFKRIIENKKDRENVYFTHVRVLGNSVNGSHSVLLKDITYSNAQSNPTLSVYNSWKSAGNFGKTSYTASEIRRADFYKLTEAGKDIYNLRRAFDESARNNAYTNLRKAS